MAKVKGIESMDKQQITFELQRGGKFVQYQYCVSVIFMTFKRGTDIYFVRADQSPVIKGLMWTLLTLLAGWWGIPWGPIWTVQSLYRNLKGGHDLTSGVSKSLGIATESFSTQIMAIAAVSAPPPVQ